MRSLLFSMDAVLRGPVPDATERPARQVPRLLGQIVLCGGFYGAVMGTYGGFEGDRSLQVLYSALKVPLLLLATFVLTLPSFFVFNTLLGVRDDFAQALRGLVATQAGFAIVLAGLAPYTLLWYASFSDYHGASLFNGFLFMVASFAARILLRRHYGPLIRRNRRHRVLLGIWLTLYIFVGIQMTWVLRPFLGWADIPVTFFRREAWVNAYTELWKTFYFFFTQ